jgi:hypothetical protein
MVSPTSEVPMTKASTKSRVHPKSSRRSKATTSESRKSRAVTKHDRALGLLRGKRGATIAAISKSMRWQPHTVRSFLTTVVKKKLGLALVSEKTESGRVYRIASAKVSAPAGSTRTTQERAGA